MSPDIFLTAGKFLETSENVLIAGAENLSEDGFSAMLALGMLRQKANQKSVSVAARPLPSSLHFLAKTDSIEPEIPQNDTFCLSLDTGKVELADFRYEKNQTHFDLFFKAKNGAFAAKDFSFSALEKNFDLVVAIGCDSVADLGEIFEKNTALFSKTPILNISSSAANSFFGKVNLVDRAAGSSSEIVAELAEKSPHLAPLLDAEIATTLLAGITAASDGFLGNETSAKSFAAAAALQKMGARHSEVIESLFKQKPLGALKIWGRILQNLEMEGQIAWSAVTKSDFDAAAANPESVKNFCDQLLRHISGAAAVALFLEEKTQTLLQIRSGDPQVSFAHFPEILGQKGKISKNGLDFEFANQKLFQVQSAALSTLFEFQKPQNSFSAATEISSPKETENPPKINPTAPRKVPFEMEGKN